MAVFDCSQVTNDTGSALFPVFGDALTYQYMYNITVRGAFVDCLSGGRDRDATACGAVVVSAASNRLSNITVVDSVVRINATGMVGRYNRIVAPVVVAARNVSAV